MIVKIKKLNEQATIPTSGSKYAAGYDLYSCEDAIVVAGKTTAIHTGIAIEIPEGYFGGVFARSGLASKQGLRPANCVGVIDSDYRGEVIAMLHNDSSIDREIKKGERIAQLVIMSYLQVDFEEAEELTDTERGTGGFGSSGK